MSRGNVPEHNTRSPAPSTIRASILTWWSTSIGCGPTTWRPRRRTRSTTTRSRGSTGSRGGLVPGVEVYAYMTHPVVERFGRDWLAHGAMDVRLRKPVYDGREVRVVIDDGEDGAVAVT